MFDDILVPTDGSDCAYTAVGYAGELAKRYDSTVHVLSVVDSRHLENGPQYEQVKADRRAIVEDCANELTERGITTRSTVETGIPYEKVLESVSEYDVDLVVMGTHGRTGVERYLLGSVTEKVVRRSDAPVLTIPGTGSGAVTPSYADVLVPTDGSTGAAFAARTAVDVARTSDATLHALSVVDTTSVGVDVRVGDILDSLEAAAWSAVEAVERQANEAGVSSVETAVERGTPYRTILSYVDDHDVDLIVMGTHGRSGVERYLLGSVTEKIVRTSPVPVLTLRRGPEGESTA